VSEESTNKQDFTIKKSGNSIPIYMYLDIGLILNGLKTIGAAISEKRGKRN
jgi:hypothetical protein